MSYNLKAMLLPKANKRPKNLFEYILYYNGAVAGVDAVIMYPILNTTYLNEDVLTKLADYDWFTFITTLTTDFPLPLGDNYNEYDTSNVVNDYIFTNYAFYDLLPKIIELFTPDNFTITDRNFMRTYVDGIVGNVLVKNAEKYKKIYDAMVIEFNPLWNVDGTETTIRTLERDGTETTAHDGKDTATKEFLNKDKTTYRTDDRTDYDIDYRNDYSTTDTTTYNNVTNTKNGEETRTVDVDKSAFNSSTKTPVETTTDNLQYENFRDVKTGNETLGKTGYDTQDKSGYENLAKRGDVTLEHTGKIKDTNDYDSSNTLTLDTIDTERTEHKRQGNIGVTTTTKLLTEYVDFAEYVDFVKTISHDIVAELCYLA